jgi:hypothetical protein
MYTTFTYSGGGNITSGIGGIAGTAQKFNLNSMYDPDSTGVGHQPYGFDQLMAIYNRFKVHRVEIALQFYQPSSAGARTFGCYQILNPSNTAATLAGLLIEDFQERPRADAVHILDGDEPTLVNFSINLPEVVGVRNMWDSQFGDNYTGTASGNPGNLIQLALTTANEGGVDSLACGYRIKICYHAMLYNPKLLAQS